VSVQMHLEAMIVRTSSPESCELGAAFTGGNRVYLEIHLEAVNT